MDQMKYILVIIVHYIYGISVTTAEFNSREACVYAAEHLETTRKATATCYPKGVGN